LINSYLSQIRPSVASKVLLVRAYRLNNRKQQPNNRKEIMKKKVFVMLAAAMGMGVAMSAGAVSWTGYGADTLGPAYIITWDGSSAVVSAGPGNAQGPYDGSDDTYIGVVNNGSTTLNYLNLSSTPDIYGNRIFWFDGDGIDAYGAPGNGSDNTGYGGPLGYFTGIAADANSGTVNFIGGIAPGDYTFFSLETDLTSVPGGGTTGGLTVGVPDGGSTMLLLGSVLGALGMLRRRFVS
jgi:hypothetical protein